MIPPTLTEIEPLIEAVDLYKGEFLEGFFLDGCSAYEEWQLLTGERLRRQVVHAVAALAAGYEQMGRLGEALQVAWRGVELERFSDAAQRRVIRLLAATGQVEAALQQYHQCCQLLKDEFDAAPDSNAASPHLLASARAAHRDLDRPHEFHDQETGNSLT